MRGAAGLAGKAGPGPAPLDPAGQLCAPEQAMCSSAPQSPPLQSERFIRQVSQAHRAPQNIQCHLRRGVPPVPHPRVGK